jgi:HemY protein
VKTVIYLLIALIVAVGAAFLVHDQLVAQRDPGYVIIGIGQWSVETSLFVVGLSLIVAFVLFYILLRVFVHAVRLPKMLKRRGGELRSKRSQEALITGLLESAEGNWEKAEKHLIRHAADSGVPLINYLTAARAAQSRGAYDQRDEYLKLAHESMPEAEVAIGLTRAELQLSHQQFEEALESLTHLNRIAPSHATVLKMMHQAYAQAEDWEGLRRLIPVLHTNKVMMEAEIMLLETETFSALLKKKSETRDADVLRELWSHVPEHIRALAGIQQLYFAAMIEAGAGAEIEPMLRQALAKEWSETLLVLYGCIELSQADEQLGLAETWLTGHPQDAVLLRVLGKLALRAQRRDKAQEYLQASLSIEPSVEAYQLMGDLLLQQNDSVRACQYFRNGLLFASNEVVAHIEQNPSGVEAEPQALGAVSA